MSTHIKATGISITTIPVKYSSFCHRCLFNNWQRTGHWDLRGTTDSQLTRFIEIHLEWLSFICLTKLKSWRSLRTLINVFVRVSFARMSKIFFGWEELSDPLPPLWCKLILNKYFIANAVFLRTKKFYKKNKLKL